MRFKFSDSLVVDTSEEPWRSEGLRGGLYANPGAGKSFTAALLVEQWLDQGGTIVIFQPRAEWHTLKQRYPVQVVGGPFLQDVPLVASEPALYARAVVEQGISMVFYTGDVEDEERLVEFITGFIRTTLRLEEQYHRPLLLVLEETQEYAPRSPSGHVAPPWVYNRMIKALKDCFTQGRKLNVCPVAISQRPQEVNFTIRQLANLVWFGGFSAQDVSYLDKEVFAPYRQKGVEVSAKDLLEVPTGEWLVIAGKKTQRVKVTEKRKTPHGADTPTLDYVQPVTEEVQKAVSALGEQLKAMLEKRTAEESELEKAKRRIRDLEKQVEDLQGKVKLGLDLRALLQAQNGAGDEELRRKLVEAEEKHQKEIQELQGTITVLKGQLGEIEGLREENQRLSDQVAKYGVLEDFFRDLIAPMIPQAPESSSTQVSEEVIEAVVDHKLQKLTSAQRRSIASASDTGIPWVDMWLPKLGPAERKIVKFLASKFPLALTKSQIALGTGLTAGGGHFSGSLSNLVKWRLVERSGDSYKLAEAPA